MLKLKVHTALKLTGLVLFLLFCQSRSQAQLIVNNAPPYNNPNYLIQNVLLGAGVVASNFSSYGHPTQMGYFNGTNSTLGLDSGVVMCSGDVTDVPPGGWGTASTNVGFAYGPGPWGGGDADLTAVANSINPAITASFDAVYLEFDFVPSSDTIQFNYVFGSDEYLTWIGSVFNDAFGFFVSGPGITGPYSSPAGFPGGATNIAVVPGTTTPITISTIHPGLNSQYFINNPNNLTNNYNGFTTVLQAVAYVQACQTYHIKLAVADCSDGILDTGVFLEAKSFSASSISVSAQPSFPNLALGDSVAMEGCGAVTLTFQRFSDPSDTLVIDLMLGGTATNGVDYPYIPDSVMFLPGQTTVQLVMFPYNDSIPEALESFIVSISDSSCSGVASSGAVIWISDPVPVTIQTQDEAFDCRTGPLMLGPNVLSGVPGYNYVWSTGETTPTIQSYPSQTTTYYVLVGDTCGTQWGIDSITVVVTNEDVIFDLAGGTIDCTINDFDLEITMLNGYGPFTFLWSTGETTQNIVVGPNVSTDYSVTVTDLCGINTATQTVHVEVINNQLYLAATDTVIDCPGDPVNLWARVSGGTPPYQYWWFDGTANTGVTTNADSTVNFAVYATDLCESDTLVAWAVARLPDVLELRAISRTDTAVFCPEDEVTLIGFAHEGRGDYWVSWDNWATSQPAADTLVVAPAVTSDYTLAVTDYCRQDTAVHTVHIEVPVYPALELDVVEDVIICEGSSTIIWAEPTGGTGNYQYHWENGVRVPYFVAAPEFDEAYHINVYDECMNRVEGVAYIWFVQPTAEFTYTYDSEGYVQFNDESTGGVNYHWDFHDGEESIVANPLHFYSLEGDQVATMVVEDEFGCRDSVTHLLEPPGWFFVPTGFTPDGDGLNDEWRIVALGVRTFEIWVYDRWGELVFHSKSLDNPWNGRYLNSDAPTGSYVYRIHATGFDQKTLSQYGQVSVLR